MSLDQIVANLVEKVERRFYGKYRGLVVDNADPELLGRLKLQVPSVLGGSVVTGWALPCVPYGGDVNQGFLFIPEVGAGVWVEFEEGDLEFPIWTGTFWSKPGGDSELPKPNKPDGSEESAVQDPPTRKIIKTLRGHTIQFEDAQADDDQAAVDDKAMITIREGVHKHVIVLDKAGITITDGVNKHVITLDTNGIKITDKKNSGNEVIMDSAGITLTTSGKKLIVGSGGVKLGGTGAAEQMLLGTTFGQKMMTLLTDLMTHQHTATSMGGPTTPPIKPLSTEVATAPLSASHYLDG